jgi:hypothetical protein
MVASNEVRKERNKQSAAKSRANRKAQFDEMAHTIKQLRLENAALASQLNALRSEKSVDSIEVPTCFDSKCYESFVDYQSWEHGGFYSDPLTSAEVCKLMTESK